MPCGYCCEHKSSSRICCFVFKTGNYYLFQQMNFLV
ncbi:hypothetical protein Pint_15759 [Pistacia integerrima]|uniref:Uncharacterized protein n=1 Tax=Pistacia integerrima TaxID=434235 RepID=A0ACC0ZBV8_9ROSI|nr:hypothetical protein Pint_15759 [Pistacia integerrima]